MIRKIETRLRSYEINGEEVKGLPNDADDLLVLGHWNRKEFVVIDFHGRNLTVAADDLVKAIRNATNHD
jgi:hypothetical protein